MLSQENSTIDMGDMSLENFCRCLIDISDKPCSAKCGKLGIHHTYSIIHADKKIAVTLKESLIASTMVDTLLHWTVCSICGKRSEVHALSEASLSVSMG
jgi:1-deoxy-D-xylulose 5-phosphate reductoisomerase